MSWHVSPWVYHVWDSLCLLDLIDYFPFHVGEIFNYNLLKFFSCPFFFSSSSGTPIIWMLVHLICLRGLWDCPQFFSLFTLFCSSEVISTILFSSSLFHSSASDILLLIPSRVFLISVIMLFVSVCLFNSSAAAAAKSLQSCPTLCHPRDSSPPGSPVPFVNWFLYFLHFVFKVFDYLFILNSFSGSLPISSSFIWTSVFLVCSFIRVVFLCLFTVFFNLSSWKFPFPRLQGKLNSFLEEGWILASFWFLTS